MKKRNISDYNRAIGEVNRKAVYDALQKLPGASSTRLVGLTGLSQPTVLKAVRAIKAGWVPVQQGEGK